VPDLTLQNVSKRFADHTALHDLSLTVEDGEIFTLLGPSGCGKSTTLWSIAGLHRPDTGVIRFGERVVFDQGRVNVEPERRNCGVVFQSYAIWPHLSVRDNVGYPLKLRKVPRAERYRRVQEVLELVELGRHAQRYPHELSGGQQQRVALARALAHSTNRSPTWTRNCATGRGNGSRPCNSGFGSPPCSSPTTRTRRSR
jgi:iron(III) transport system ATP-binding protein